MIDGRVGGGGGVGSHQYIHNTPADYTYVSALVTVLLAHTICFPSFCLHLQLNFLYNSVIEMHSLVACL